MDIPRPTHLRCEYLKNPLGVDSRAPRFSWILQHPERGQTQEAYQIIVSSDAEAVEKLTWNVWDSGRVESDKTYGIPFAGKSLASGQRYYWRVRWWDNVGRVSGYSDGAYFESGLLSNDDWKAAWISKKEVREFHSRGSTLLGKDMGAYIQAHALYLRKVFSIDKPISRARAYVCGLGWYELHINGSKVGNRVLDPAQTDYRRLALYSTYDVTDFLRSAGSEGKTRCAVGIILGNGRHIKNFGYGPPRLLLQIAVEDIDGVQHVFCSDESWKISYGPLQENGMYSGERYDARLEMPGWDLPEFDDSTWEQAIEVEGPPVASQMMPPIRVTEKLRPKTMSSPRNGVYVFDFGQNFSGWVRLRVQGPQGCEVGMRHAELLEDDGSLNVSPNQNAEATDVYVLRGGGVETYEPRFTYHGFRYVEVTGFPGIPTLESIEGCCVHSDVEQTGSFACSNELLNRIHQNVLWGQLSNLMSVPTDCPQRDERHGWLGDAHLAAEQAILNFDMAALYSKFLRDIQLAQKDDGSLPDTVPPYLERLYPADPAWSAAYMALAWYLYFYCGDTRALEQHYGSLKKYVEFLRNNAQDNIVRKLGKYGDWCPPGSIAPKRTPVELTSSWYYYHDTMLLSVIAGILARKDEEAYYGRLAQDIKEAFNREFLRGDEYQANRFAPVDRSPSQTSNVLPLYLNMVPEEKVSKVLERLLDSVVSEQDYHLDTGIIGTRYLLDVLTQRGKADVAYRIVTQKTYPGWGYMVEEGATTLWERWEKITGGGMNSHNHIMFGSVDAWFYRVLAGISSLSPGWSEILFKPHILGDLTHASATVRTVRGSASISWRRDETHLAVDVSVPVTSTAVIQLPLLWEETVIAEGETVIWDRGKALDAQTKGLSRGIRKDQVVSFLLGSGTYSFSVQRIA